MPLVGDTAAFLLWLQGLAIAPPLGEYHLQQEVFEEIAAGAAESPWPVEVEQIGVSAGKQPIWAFHLRVAEPQGAALVIGGIHAMEWLSTEVALDTMLWAMRTPPRPLTVVPLLNPDGRARVEEDLAAGRNRYRRGNQRGVDLNRDFRVNRGDPPFWARIIPAYYQVSEAPLSQPESRALDALASREGYDRAVSLHAFGNFIFYPWAGRFSRPADWAALDAVGHQMAAAQRPSYRVQQLGRWAFFFRARGAEIDHLYGEYGMYAYLVELGGSGLRPWRPHTMRSYFIRYNPENSSRPVAAGRAAVRALLRAELAPLAASPSESLTQFSQ